MRLRTKKQFALVKWIDVYDIVRKGEHKDRIEEIRVLSKLINVDNDKSK